MGNRFGTAELANVLRRTRAGVLEAGTVDLLREVGLGERMNREGQPPGDPQSSGPDEEVIEANAAREFANKRPIAKRHHSSDRSLPSSRTALPKLRCKAT